MRILFIANGSIGDVIMSTGIMKHLLDKYPEAMFTIAAGPASAPLFTSFPKLERLIIIHKKSWSRHWFIFWNEVYWKRWDLVVDMRNSLTSYVVRTKQRKIFSNPDKSKSKTEQISAMFGIPFLPTYLWVSNANIEKTKTYLPTNKFIVMAPKSNASYKNWPIERFTELAHKLLEKEVFASSVIVVLGLANQRASIAPLVNSLPNSKVLDLTGQTDIPALCAILKQAQLFIGNDSGLLHMAGALGTPLVGLYGPNNDKEYAPRGAHVRVAKVREFASGEKEIRGSTIINQLAVGQVEAAVDDLILTKILSVA